ncbi:MAG: hypothetical protein IJF95_00640 [Erysipelotrichaceae bacterium]|nr:hypothetical protein [Erysipelotrichaceae bacterium]
MYHYLPSCKVKQIHPETSLKIQNYLRSKEVEICGCCRISQDLFHSGDTVVTNCTSCAIITDERSPQCKEMSLYEYLLEDASFPWPDHHGERITVQDCYRTIHKPEVQKAVRECLKKMNMIPVEIEENYEKTRFDGPFRYQEIQAGNLRLAPEYFNKMAKEYIEVLAEEDQIKRMEAWAKQYTTDRVVVYCNSCLKGVQMGKANGVHIIDLLADNL